MKRGAALILAAILAIVAIIFGALYFTTTAQKNEAIRILTDEKNTLTADVADKAAQIATLSTEKDALSADVADKAAQIATLSAEKDALTADVADKATQIETLSAEKDALTADVADKATQIETLTGEKDALTADVADKATQIATLSTEKDALTADVADKAAQIATLSTEKDALTADVADKAAQIATLSTEKDALTADVADKAAQIATLSAEKDALTADVADKATQIATLSAEKDTLSADVADKTAQIETLTTEKDALSAQVQKLEKIVSYEGLTEEELLFVAGRIEAPLVALGYDVKVHLEAWTCIDCGAANERAICTACQLPKAHSELRTNLAVQCGYYIWNDQADDDIGFDSTTTIYKQDYASDMSLYPVLRLTNSADEEMSIKIKAVLNGYTWTYDASTLKAGGKNNFYLDAKYVQSGEKKSSFFYYSYPFVQAGENVLKWYANDVLIAEYRFTIHEEGHSDFYQYVQENVTVSMSLGIWNTKDDKMISNHVDVGDVSKLGENQVYCPRITVYNNGAQAIENIMLGALTNNQTASTWTDGYTFAAADYRSFANDNAAYHNGSNLFTFYLNGVEVYRGNYVIRSMEEEK